MPLGEADVDEDSVEVLLDSDELETVVDLSADFVEDALRDALEETVTERDSFVE